VMNHPLRDDRVVLDDQDLSHAHLHNGAHLRPQGYPGGRELVNTW
jgi:hypothetical protein